MLTLKINLFIKPYQLDDLIENTIKTEVHKLLYNKTISDIGIITQIHKIRYLAKSQILYDNGDSLFLTYVDVEAFQPKVNDIVETRVKLITLSGFYTEKENIEIFTAFLDSGQKVQLDDLVKIKITKVKYNNSNKNYIIIGKLV